MFHSKKGIQPTHAILILLALTMSAAGGAFYWLTVVQPEEVIIGETIKFTEEQLTTAGTVATSYNSQANELTIIVENKANTEVPIATSSKAPTTVWLVKDETERIICPSDWSGKINGPNCLVGCNEPIQPGERRKIILNNLGPNTLCPVGAEPKGSLIQFNIDFSGIAVVDGNFIR